jgi:uncharacterized protein YndB with AHSA1/START domain
MVVCEVATKVGDRYRYEWRHEDGAQFGIGGVCREFVPPERIVCTELMDGYQSESLVTTLLAEQGRKTTLTTVARSESQEIRDMMLKSGMERAVAASYDRLAELVESAGASSKARGATEA